MAFVASRTSYLLVVLALARPRIDTMPPKKRGPRPKASGLESRLDTLPPTFPGKTNGKGLDQSQWDGCRAILEGVLVAKTGNRFIADVFRELPDKGDYPEYFEVIPQPESLDNICVRTPEDSMPSEYSEVLTVRPN